MDKKLTREQLYDLVWQKPMVQVAKDYGFSDRGMSKLCERYAIPVPPRGYWAKKQAGHKVTKPPLIVLSSDKPETLILFRQAVTKVKEVLDNSQEAKAGYPQEIKAAIDREKLKENFIKVPKSLVNLHPIIDRWLEYQRSRYDSYTRYGGIKPDQLTALEKRSWRILSALLKSLEVRGFKVEADRYYQQSINVSSERDNIYITIEERIRYFRRELTPEEKKERSYSTQRWMQVREPTGLLRLKLLRNEKNHMLKEFCDAEGIPLEDQLNNAVVAIIEEIWQEKEDRLRREAEDHKRYLNWLEKSRLEELEKQELARYQAFEHKAAQWQKAAGLRNYIAAIETARFNGQVDIEQAEFDRWKSWALAYIQKIDPIVQGDPLIILPINAG